MPDLSQVTSWIDAYRRAWNSNDADDIGQLFAEDAQYYTEPFSQPWRGRQAIVDNWLARRDEPAQTEFAWHPVAITEELAVVQGNTAYFRDAVTYSNLWVIRFDQTGQCTEFTEWWMQQPTG